MNSNLINVVPQQNLQFAKINMGNLVGYCWITVQHALSLLSLYLNFRNQYVMFPHTKSFCGSLEDFECFESFLIKLWSTQARSSWMQNFQGSLVQSWWYTRKNVWKKVWWSGKPDDDILSSFKTLNTFLDEYASLTKVVGPLETFM